MPKPWIRNGTPDHSRPEMCLTCAYATIARGYAETQREIRCNEFGRIKWPVYECTEYRHKLQPTLYEMKQMASVVEPTKDGLGFTSRKLTREEWHE